MPVWRCPHCATPQAEASRCWVCRRSTTSCVTCRYYRRGIAVGLGVCGLDPAHPVAAATDVQPCWVAAPAATAAAAAAALVGVGPGPLDWLATGVPARSAVGRPGRTFVPVEQVARAAEAVAVAVLEPAADDAPTAVPAPMPAVVETPEDAQAEPVAAGPAIPGRWWLWGDPEPWPER